MTLSSARAGLAMFCFMFFGLQIAAAPLHLEDLGFQGHLMIGNCFLGKFGKSLDSELDTWGL